MKHLIRMTFWPWVLVILLVAPQAGFAQKKAPKNQAELQMSYAPIVKKAAPAVVNIYSERHIQTNALVMNDPLFEYFFGQNLFGGITRNRVENSLGSGVIVSKAGLVVTNFHVIDGADEIKVVLSDKREYKAQPVLMDERTDLALLQIRVNNPSFPHLTFSDSDRLEVGDIVLAIGNPFGVGQTVTSGIISALARTDVGITDYEFFIQTDAAINPGNSGGALVNMKGEIVGINTAIYSKSGASHGIGFATPSNMVSTLVKAYQQNGRLVRPWFGASSQNVTAEIAASLGLQTPSGVLISDVYPGSSAYKGGLQRGDIVVGINGKPVTDEQSLRYRIATLAIGTQVTLDVLRQGQPLRTSLVLEPATENPPRETTELEGNHPLNGVQVMNLSPAVGQEMGLQEYRGVIVSNVRKGAASILLVQKGDIIEQINGKQVSNVAEVLEQLRLGRRPWNILLRRGTKRITIAIN